MDTAAISRAQEIAAIVTEALGGYGLFGVELFVRGEEVWFSEVSPRPHDTGLVTLQSQRYSEFALHVRAILGAQLGNIDLLGPAASVAVLGEGSGRKIRYHGLDDVLSQPHVDARIFGKPEVAGKRRLAVILAHGGSVEEALNTARDAAQRLTIEINA